VTSIGKRAIVSAKAYLGANVVLLGRITVKDGVIIEDGCTLGKPRDLVVQQLLASSGCPSLLDWDALPDANTIIAAGCRIGRLSTICSGSTLGADVFCKDYSYVGWDTVIGARSRLMYGAQVHSRVRIGEDCRIGGFCCNDARIGHRVSMFGYLSHAYRVHGAGMLEPAPTVDDDVIIGFGAHVIGGIRIGRGSYVAAGSVVTKNIPPNSIVTHVNAVCPLSDWRGRLGLTGSGYAASETDVAR